MEKKPRHWIYLLGVVIIVAITLAVIFIPRFFSAKAVKITSVQTGKDVHEIEGVYYWDFHFWVDIENSGTSDVSDLELVVDLKVDHTTVASDTKTIGTLKASWTAENQLLSIFAVRNDQLYDAQGNYKGDITAVITLYSGNEVLDQLTTGVF